MKLASIRICAQLYHWSAHFPLRYYIPILPNSSYVCTVCLYINQYLVYCVVLYSVVQLVLSLYCAVPYFSCGVDRAWCGGWVVCVGIKTELNKRVKACPEQGMGYIRINNVNMKLYRNTISQSSLKCFATTLFAYF